MGNGVSNTYIEFHTVPNGTPEVKFRYHDSAVPADTSQVTDLDTYEDLSIAAQTSQNDLEAAASALWGGWWTSLPVGCRTSFRALFIALNTYS